MNALDMLLNGDSIPREEGKTEILRLTKIRADTKEARDRNNNLLKFAKIRLKNGDGTKADVEALKNKMFRNQMAIEVVNTTIENLRIVFSIS